MYNQTCCFVIGCKNEVRTLIPWPYYFIHAEIAKAILRLYTELTEFSIIDLNFVLFHLDGCSVKQLANHIKNISSSCLKWNIRKRNIVAEKITIKTTKTPITVYKIKVGEIIKIIYFNNFWVTIGVLARSLDEPASTLRDYTKTSLLGLVRKNIAGRLCVRR